MRNVFERYSKRILVIFFVFSQFHNFANASYYRLLKRDSLYFFDILRARRAKPCVLFFDEFDSLASR